MNPESLLDIVQNFNRIKKMPSKLTITSAIKIIQKHKILTIAKRVDLHIPRRIF